MAAVVSAGAAALTAVRAAKRQGPADAGLVGLIERVANATSSAGSVDEALLACVEQVCRWTGWPIGHVYFAEHDEVAPSQLWYLSDPERFAHFRAATERTSLARGAGLPGRVLESGQAEWIVDVSCDANFPRRGVAAESGVRGGLAFPVPLRDRCFAVVECFSLDAVLPNDRWLEVVSHIGRQLGRLIAGIHVEEALRESESRFRSVAETANDAIIAADEQGLILSWNPAARRMFGYDEREVVGRPLSLLMPERFRALHDAGLRRVVETPEHSRILGKTVEVVGLRADGAEFPIELSLATWTSDEGRFFSGIIRDIAARKDAEDQARALEIAPDPIVKVDAARRIVLANARTEQLFGYQRSELVGREVEELFAGHSAHRARDLFEAAAGGAPMRQEYGVELTGRRSDGSEFPIDVTLSRGDSDRGGVITSIMRDVTERTRFEAQLRHLADHDHLTGLFNRRWLERELAAHVAEAERRHRPGALLLLDLDRFKYVNDTHGHNAGDDVVRTMGRALADCIGDAGEVARLGGDEFAVLLTDADRAAAEVIASRVAEAVAAQAVIVDELAISITTSVGVALFGMGETTAAALLAAADMAMYAAKEDGGNRHQVFDEADARLAGMQARLAQAAQIRRALAEDRFVLYWQPIIEVATGDATHHELLLRMLGEDGRVIPPAGFIETAERFGLIQELDRWVVRNAIALLADDPDSEHRIEVNLSGASIGDPALPLLIEHELAATGVDPSRLVFEITETAAIANMEEARAFAERLTRLGCRFALDDFGAGFSSFYYLKHLPLDYLKIDGDFIRNLAHNPTDQLVVTSMVDIARGMGMKTIAEFVEDAETLEAVRRHGIDYSQGYFHARPEPVRAAAVT